MVENILPYKADSQDSYLIILGAGPQQKLAYQKARAMNIKTIAVDYNPNSACFPLADKHILASVKNSDECIKGLKKLNLKYSGVLTYGIEVSPIVSAVAREFDLISVSEKVAYNTTNKCARSTVLSESSIPIPKFKIIEQFCNPEIDYPFIVKPSDNSGSRGVRMVRNRSEWECAFNESKSLSGDGRVVVEEMLYGNEISIEAFVINREVFVYGFTDRNFIRNGAYDPYFMEDGSSSPSKLPLEIVNQAKKVFSSAVIALGIENGPTKGDLIVNNDGVFVFEVTSRLSPGFSMFSPLVVGVDPLSCNIKWSLGRSLSGIDLEPKFQKGMVHRYFFHKPGVITNIKNYDGIHKMPGVLQVIELNKFGIGNRLNSVSYINRLFYVITIGETRQEAENYAIQAIESVSIVTEDA
jgi:biotin carboxylase